MVLPIDTAVRTLLRAAEDQAPDLDVVGRLSDLRELLADDLAWVEVRLAQAASQGEGERSARDAAEHLVKRGGKRVRPMALLLSAACFGPIPAVARELAVVAELVHSATFLHDDVHDDVIDDGTERRSIPTARTLWGNAVSVLAGDLLLVEALERTGRHAPDLLFPLFATLRDLVNGEIVQLRGRVDLDGSRATYDRVLSGKTASLFRWATSAGARVGGATTEDQRRLGTFGELVGVAFQLVDDALDYSSEAAHKTAGADLRDGKMTLPLVLALERAPELIHAVRRIHRGDDAPLEELRRVVVGCGACDEVRELAGATTARALEVLRAVPASGARTLLEDVAAALPHRNG